MNILPSWVSTLLNDVHQSHQLLETLDPGKDVPLETWARQGVSECRNARNVQRILTPLPSISCIRGKNCCLYSRMHVAYRKSPADSDIVSSQQKKDSKKVNMKDVKKITLDFVPIKLFYPSELLVVTTFLHVVKNLIDEEGPLVFTEQLLLNRHLTGQIISQFWVRMLKANPHLSGNKLSHKPPKTSPSSSSSSSSLRTPQANVDSCVRIFKAFLSAPRICLYCFRWNSCALRILHKRFPLYMHPRGKYTEFTEGKIKNEYAESALIYHNSEDNYDGLPKILVKPMTSKLTSCISSNGCFLIIKEDSSIHKTPLVSAKATGKTPSSSFSSSPSLSSEATKSAKHATLTGKFSYTWKLCFIPQKKIPQSIPQVIPYSPALMHVICNNVLKNTYESSWFPAEALSFHQLSSIQKKTKHNAGAMQEEKEEEEEEEGDVNMAASHIEVASKLETLSPLQYAHTLLERCVSITVTLNETQKMHFEIARKRYHERKAMKSIIDAGKSSSGGSTKTFSASIKQLQTINNSRSPSSSVQSSHESIWRASTISSTASTSSTSHPLVSNKKFDLHSESYWDFYIPPPGYILNHPGINHLRDLYGSTTEIQAMKDNEEASSCASNSDSTMKTDNPNSKSLMQNKKNKKQILDATKVLDKLRLDDISSSKTKHKTKKQKAGPMFYSRSAVSPEKPWFVFDFKVFVFIGVTK